VDHWHADGALPAPGVYGVPEQWPHVRALYERTGFVHDGHTEIVLIARVDELPGPQEPPIPGLRLGRALGVNGTRFYGSIDDKLVGYMELAAPGPVEQLLEYAWPEEEALRSLLARLGFRELTRTARGWHHRVRP
jgi:hypothetical protein